MDIHHLQGRHLGMGVTPLPRRGTVLSGRDAAARMLRVSFHPDVDRVVISIWDHDVCMATLRLAPDDVPELVRGLTASLLSPKEATQDESTTVAIAMSAALSAAPPAATA